MCCKLGVDRFLAQFVVEDSNTHTHSITAVYPLRPADLNTWTLPVPPQLEFLLSSIFISLHLLPSLTEKEKCTPPPSASLASLQSTISWSHDPEQQTDKLIKHSAVMNTVPCTQKHFFKNGHCLQKIIWQSCLCRSVCVLSCLTCCPLSPHDYRSWNQ